jgi:hypothetical protein
MGMCQCPALDLQIPVIPQLHATNIPQIAVIELGSILIVWIRSIVKLEYRALIIAQRHVTAARNKNNRHKKTIDIKSVRHT